MNLFLSSLLSSGNPVLPSATAMRMALHLLWAIVLGSGVLLLAWKLARPYRLGLSVLVMFWTLVPGSASPAYWLGLAFQTPSLMSAVICLGWFLHSARLASKTDVARVWFRLRAVNILAGMGVVLGWVLFLDTLAWWPVPVYAWGFSSAAFGAVAVLTTLLWIVWGATGANRMTLGLVGLVLTLFALTRWPTGNIWDSLIDPWLWAGLHMVWLLGAGRRLVRH